MVYALRRETCITGKSERASSHVTATGTLSLWAKPDLCLERPGTPLASATLPSDPAAHRDRRAQDHLLWLPPPEVGIYLILSLPIRGSGSQDSVIKTKHHLAFCRHAIQTCIYYIRKSETSLRNTRDQLCT